MRRRLIPWRKQVLLPVLFLILIAIYFFQPLKLGFEMSNLFLTVTTFIFSILAGFFIARQDNRYNEIRSTIAEFDGNVSALHRSFAVFGEEKRKAAADIIGRHYGKILETKRWDYHFTHKSTTITDLGNLLGDISGDEQFASFKNETVSNMIASLDSLQVARKRMVALHVERMPLFEWAIVGFLALLLLFSLLIVPTSSGGLFDSIMKAVFGTMIVLVLLLLKELDSLELFEGILGEASAKDMLSIIEGTR